MDEKEKTEICELLRNTADDTVRHYFRESYRIMFKTYATMLRLAPLGAIERFVSQNERGTVYRDEVSAYADSKANEKEDEVRSLIEELAALQAAPAKTERTPIPALEETVARAVSQAVAPLAGILAAEKKKSETPSETEPKTQTEENLMLNEKMSEILDNLAKIKGRLEETGGPISKQAAILSWEPEHLQALLDSLSKSVSEISEKQDALSAGIERLEEKMKALEEKTAAQKAKKPANENKAPDEQKPNASDSMFTNNGGTPEVNTDYQPEFYISEDEGFDPSEEVPDIPNANDTNSDESYEREDANA